MDTSWAKFRQEIEQTRQACTGKEWCVDWLDGAITRLDHSIRTIENLRDAVGGCLAGLDSPVGVFACGSYGRLEASAASDLDILMVVQQNANAIGDEDIKRYHDCMARILEAAEKVVPSAFVGKNLADFSSPEFRKDYIRNREFDSDLYRRWVPEDAFLDGRFDLGDTALRQIRRVSLILEAEPIAANDYSATFRRTALERLYAIKLDAAGTGMIRTARPCWNLFARELARFLHTSHFLHEHKIRIEGKAPLVRSTKLVTTRRMLALSALMVILDAEHNHKAAMLLAPPIVRLCALLRGEVSVSPSTDAPPTLRMLKQYVGLLDEIEFERQIDLPSAEYDDIQNDASALVGYLRSEFDQLLQEFIDFRRRHWGQDLRSLLAVLT